MARSSTTARRVESAAAAGSTRHHRPVREGHGARRPGPDRPGRAGAGDSRAEWRRQDHLRPDRRHPVAADQWRAAGAGHRCRPRPGERPAGHRPGGPVRRGRAGHDRPREPGDDGPALRAPRQRGAAGRGEVWTAVRALVAGGTDVALTTHYLDEADELADHVVVIDHGRAIAAGPLGDIKASVGRDDIEVAVADPARLDAAGQILRRVTANPPRLDRSGRRASAPASGGSSALATMIRCLDDAAIAVDEIGVRRPTLDEVFLTLTSDHEGTPVTASNSRHRGSR